MKRIDGQIWAYTTILLLFACAPSPQIKINDSRILTSGMTTLEVVKALKNEPGKTFKIFDGSDSLKVLRYLADMQYDDGKMQINDVFYVTLKNDTTSYWGLIKKMKLSEDPRKKAISDSICKYDSEYYGRNNNDTTITNTNYAPPTTHW
jgi:hypothetical protein